MPNSWMHVCAHSLAVARFDWRRYLWTLNACVLAGERFESGVQCGASSTCGVQLCCKQPWWLAAQPRAQVGMVFMYVFAALIHMFLPLLCLWMGLVRAVLNHRIWLYIWWFPCQNYRLYIESARTVYMHRIWPYIWWFPCQRNRT